MYQGTSQGQMTRSSLGRIARIGELYDVRTECLRSWSLFRNPCQHLIVTTEIPHTEFTYKATDNLSERFDLLNVEGEMQLNVLLGLVKVEGSGKFLREEKKSEKTVSCTLNCRLQTVREKLFSSFSNLVPHVDLEVLKSPEYTHFISEITWGTNCLMNLEVSCESESNKQETKARVEADLLQLKIVSLKGGGNMNKSDSKELGRNNVDIKIHADVLPDGEWPTTVEEFQKFLGDVPRLVKKVNGGKGMPLSFVLTPLEDVRRAARVECEIGAVFRRIDESFLMSVVYLFENIEQVKQKLGDLCGDMQRQEKYVRSTDLKEARKMREQLSVEESKLKLGIAEEWSEARSGRKFLRDVIRQVERLKSQTLNLLSYEDYIDSCSSILRKLSTVAEYLSLGVEYLGRGETLETVRSGRVSDEMIVLVTSSEMEEADPELGSRTRHYFLTLASERKPNTRYVVVDFDFVEKSLFKVDGVRCVHLMGTEILSQDLLGDFIAESERNLARPNRESVELADQKPGNRTVLEMTCPGFKTGTCPSDMLEWSCSECKSNVEYGFDNYFYCTCGRSPVDSFEYRCRSARHGAGFIPAEPEFLESFLSKLRPLKELNILVLGQSGVGKSTWINSIVNYLTYDSLETAEELGVICTIPTKVFTYDSVTNEEKTVEIGAKSQNEVTKAGESATQAAHTYGFIWEGTYIRIIDSPGLGDTRGIEKDKENLRNIIDHLGYLKELHGVCILLRASDSRSHVLLCYCINELLTHLHKSVVKNIVFCFTNARSTLYSAGPGSAVLHKIIDKLGIQREIALGKHNMFCLDNEAFLFLCSLNFAGVHHEEVVRNSFAKSWDISSEETKRLFNTIKTFHPHLLEETISLVKARSRVLTLTKPLAEISKTIMINVALLEKKEKEISDTEMTIQELLKDLVVRQVRLVSKRLDYPRTVCTNRSCIEYIPFKGTGVSDTHYKTHCHTHCYIDKVTPQTTNNCLLEKCFAMTNGVCRICGCGWQVHMHLTYDQTRVEEDIVDNQVEEKLSQEQSGKEKIEKFVEKVRSTTEKYKNEHEIIIQACVKFGRFLRSNAITVYNDSVAGYLDYLIEEEMKKPYKSSEEEEVLKSLRKTLAHYKKEVQVLEEVLKKGENDQNPAENITLEEVYRLEQSLYELELTGSDIRKSVEASRSTGEKMMLYGESSVQIHKPKKKKSILRKTWNFVAEVGMSALGKTKEEKIKASMSLG